MNRLRLLLICLPSIVLAGCWPSFSDHRGSLSQPTEAHVDFSNNILNDFDAKSRPILFRYFAGNSRWEIREERGIKYAVRREKIDGRYETSLNGFYYEHGGGSPRQTRVLVSFDKPYGFGRDRGTITRAKAGEEDVAVILEGPHTGKPGHSSYIIIEGEGLFLEIYDQAPEKERLFTKRAFAEVSAELVDVKKHLSDVESTGILPIPSHYTDKSADKGRFDVLDGVQPGIYLLDAAVNPTSQGFVYAKAFDDATGSPLSAARIISSSKRHLGWSSDGKQYFPYQAEITVYEGDWSKQYKARFELWHHSEDGTKTKLGETSRMIHGWQR